MAALEHSKILLISYYLTKHLSQHSYRTFLNQFDSPKTVMNLPFPRSFRYLALAFHFIIPLYHHA